MYGHSFPTFSRADCFPLGHISPDFTPPPSEALMVIPDYQLAAMETLCGQSTTTTTSGCSSYGSPASLASCATTTQGSLHNNGYHCHFTSPYDFLDMETSSVRRVFSTGDLQHSQRSESPLSSESSVIMESMSRATKYSPEEKKERIERYRSKRNQRNFTKKIKYACRKTLADSRPRIRGRFARNDETEKNPQLLQWSNIYGEEEEEHDDTWIKFLQAFSVNSFAN
ncbi:hypothetical protein K2173_023524 [Erythroxylum novogranatense]|uniref:CCT domain-containing protein n=1 Tax=Erythroxylum novogranatense TaxID=1862640 RepID=A0AAV8TQT2_9ROSI|nr:hypothetical protein K2173_023524 [Erythroxylum novogranatense]